MKYSKDRSKVVAYLAVFTVQKKKKKKEKEEPLYGFVYIFFKKSIIYF